MSMYNLIEYSDNYSKTSGSLWQFCKEIPTVNNNGDMVNFDGTNEIDSFKFKTKITGQTDNNGRIDNPMYLRLVFDTFAVRFPFILSKCLFGCL